MVRYVVRKSKGEVIVVMDVGVFYGYGRRSIAVPIDAMMRAAWARHRSCYLHAEAARSFSDICPGRNHRGLA